MFHVGQKVAFVGFPQMGWRDRWRELIFPIPGPWPAKGQIYTIVKIIIEDDHAYLSLLELRETINKHWGEGWDHMAFRAIVEKKTDISIFTKMLAPPMREKTDARAE